jgi:hypothetical protein
VWKNLEWVDLKPRLFVSAVSLYDIETICRRIGFEIERHGEFIRIIGYRKLSSQLLSSRRSVG